MKRNRGYSSYRSKRFMNELRAYERDIEFVNIRAKRSPRFILDSMDYTELSRLSWRADEVLRPRQEQYLKDDGVTHYFPDNILNINWKKLTKEKRQYGQYLQYVQGFNFIRGKRGKSYVATEFYYDEAEYCETEQEMLYKKENS